MKRRAVDGEDPDRLYVITGGRSHTDEKAFDAVTLIVSECDPKPGMQSEHVKILQMCCAPMAVVDISAELCLPVSVVKILLCDLLDTGAISVRHESSAPDRTLPFDRGTLEEVLIGLENF